MNSPDPLHIIFGVAAVIAFWIAANQLIEMGRRWLHWRSLLRAHHTGRASDARRRPATQTELVGAPRDYGNGFRLPVPPAERRAK